MTDPDKILDIDEAGLLVSGSNAKQVKERLALLLGLRRKPSTEYGRQLARRMQEHQQNTAPGEFWIHGPGDNAPVHGRAYLAPTGDDMGQR